MSKAIWVVITGLIRKRDYFTQTLEMLVMARERGLIQGIVMSTWTGEVDGYGLRPYLRDIGVVLVENRPLASPTAGLAHNIERQKFLFYWGLNCVPLDAFVFKTRPDQVITTNEKFFELLDHFQAMDMTVADADREVLPARIWCGRFQPNIPFWYDDRYFFTTQEVALRMTAMSSDIRLLAHDDNFIAEINWYQPLFSRATFWANAVMRVNWLDIARLQTSEAVERYKDDLRKTNFYWLAMAIYEQVTNRFFYAGYSGFDLSDYDYLGPDPNRAAELPMHYGGQFLDFFPDYAAHPVFQYARGLCDDLRTGPINDPALWREAVSGFITQNRHLVDNAVEPSIS